MSSGRLITIEGIDGAGKTTLVNGLTQALSERGREVHVLREPGGVALSECIRDLVKDPNHDIDPRAEALLYAAARAQLVGEKLKPLLKTGAWILLDRFVDSSLAYQGAGRDLGIDHIRELNLFATGGLQPDKTLLLRIDAESGLARVDGRGEQSDRLEQEKSTFFSKIVDGYDQLAAEDPERISVIDARRSQTEVLSDAVAALDDLLD